MTDKLVACCRALPCSNHGPRQKELLQPEEMLPCRVMRDRIDLPRQNLVLVRHPVVVPLVKSVSVVASNGLDRVYFEPGKFALLHIPAVRTITTQACNPQSSRTRSRVGRKQRNSRRHGAAHSRLNTRAAHGRLVTSGMNSLIAEP